MRDLARRLSANLPNGKVATPAAMKGTTCQPHLMALGPSGAFAVLPTLGWDPTEAIQLIHAARTNARIAYADDALDWWHRTSRDPTIRSLGPGGIANSCSLQSWAG